jgi:prepilin-type N-terminal cleavage/methylation domain-containing protein
MKNKNIGGFTLIEMLIVIAIIAILSAVVLTGVNGFQASARDTARIGDMKNIQDYLELYFNKCGYYPGSLNTSGVCVSGAPDKTKWSDFAAEMTEAGGIATQFPSDPVSGREFCYGVSPDGLSYVLGTVLETDNSILHGSQQGDPPGTNNSISSLTIPGVPACGASGSNTYWVNS